MPVIECGVIQVLHGKQLGRESGRLLSLQLHKSLPHDLSHILRAQSAFQSVCTVHIDADAFGRMAPHRQFKVFRYRKNHIGAFVFQPVESLFITFGNAFQIEIVRRTYLLYDTTGNLGVVIIDNRHFHMAHIHRRHPRDYQHHQQGEKNHHLGHESIPYELPELLIQQY